ncbi:helix-turn-helix protein [compost metagenome]
MVDGATATRAWREHLGLTQTEVAERLGISPSAYALQETSLHHHHSTRERIAKALDISQDQLSI